MLRGNRLRVTLSSTRTRERDAEYLPFLKVIELLLSLPPVCITVYSDSDLTTVGPLPCPEWAAVARCLSLGYVRCRGPGRPLRRGTSAGAGRPPAAGLPWAMTAAPDSDTRRAQGPARPAGSWTVP